MLTFKSLFGDHAVIASSCPRILGFAQAHSCVTVQLAGHRVETTTNPEGLWCAEFPALPEGGPHTLTASDSTGSIVSHDILLGEVWLGSGQSNMEWTLGQTKETEQDIAAAHEPHLRIFTVTKSSCIDEPQRNVTGYWQIVSPETASSLSSVGFYFGRKLTHHLQRPVGMVISAWGGSAIIPWIPETIFHSRPEYAPALSDLAQVRINANDPGADKPHIDPGISSEAARYMATSHDDSSWDNLKVPGLWQDQEWLFNGAVWYRKIIEIPSEWIGQELLLNLGIIDDCDHTWVNGIEVGSTGLETANFWAVKRSYPVPASTLTSNTVTIAVRVFDIWGGGGIMGDVTLQLKNNPSSLIKISGSWKAKPELKLPSRQPGGNTGPSSLWNGMVAPLVGVTLHGFIWYQGESDTTRAKLYRLLLSDLITSWRKLFSNSELPFGIVQLASHRARKAEPSEDDWAELRESQRIVAATIPACGLIMAIDAGEAEDIHPRYKKIVGERLALWALRENYAQRQLPYSGPLYADHWKEEKGIRLRFTHAEGLRIRGTALRGFEIAGADRQWVWAEASIQGDTVFVSSTAVLEPQAVRYAWQSNPETTLENVHGFPASPFSTD